MHSFPSWEISFPHQDSISYLRKGGVEKAIRSNQMQLDAIIKTYFSCFSHAFDHLTHSSAKFVGNFWETSRVRRLSDKVGMSGIGPDPQASATALAYRRLDSTSRESLVRPHAQNSFENSESGIGVGQEA